MKISHILTTKIGFDETKKMLIFGKIDQHAKSANHSEMIGTKLAAIFYGLLLNIAFVT